MIGVARIDVNVDHHVVAQAEVHGERREIGDVRVEELRDAKARLRLTRAGDDREELVADKLVQVRGVRFRVLLGGAVRCTRGLRIGKRAEHVATVRQMVERVEMRITSEPS